ncbi:MAG: hypothetical protein ACKO96_23340, partial [Flammeovirgaceae bacterium]
MNNERQTFFLNQCKNNQWYQINKVQAEGKDCMQDFMNFQNEIYALASTAYFVTAVWLQISQVFVRKTSSDTIFTIKRLISNRAIFYSIIIE